MRALTAAVLMSVSLAIPVLANSALENNALYQWDTKNGTPTYSPDPPPKGVKYIVVGPDLQPLEQQPAPLTDSQRSDANKTVAAANNANAKVTPTLTAKKWKPVRYANAPANNAQPIIKTKRTIETSAVAEIAAPIAYESDDCLTIKREKLVLESQFARAKTDAEMDSAVLSLRDKSSEYRQKCQRN